jgi:hypothetical protein|tara:strand:- start:3441 stop:3707 length:267 start_codon:yes stop_codon:yes gene_type:complete
VPNEVNGDLRKEIASLKTAVAVAETVLGHAKQHMAIETQHRVSISLQLATITERLATQQRIIWSLLAVLLIEGAGMAAYVLRALINGS